MSNPLIRPVSDEYLAMTVDALVDDLEFIYRRPASPTMRRIVEVQVRFVLKGDQTESPYDPIEGFLYRSFCVRSVTASVADWLRYDYKGPCEDGKFLERLRHLTKLANGIEVPAS